MYISRIFLENFIGIWSGTGQSKIEILFPDTQTTESNVILFMGRNGSGKSTLLSTLHPFAGIYDSRDDQFIRLGMDGSKEIDIVDGPICYSIQHLYKNSGKKSKTVSFIKKIVEGYEPEELNPNGGVNSFKDIVFDLWGIEEDFFKVGRLASKTSNFIDMTTAARKEMIVNYLPSLEPWIEAYKNANERCKETERELNYLAREIKSLEDASVLTSKKKASEDIILLRQTSLNESNVQLGAIQQEVLELEKDPEVKNIKPVIEKSKVLDGDLEIISKRGRVLIEKFPFLSTIKDKTEEFVAECMKKCVQVEKKLSSTDALLKEKRQQRSDLMKKLADVKNSLEQFKTFNQSEEDVKKEIEELQAKAASLEAEMNAISDMFTVEIDVEQYSTNDRSLYKELSVRFSEKLKALLSFLSPYTPEEVKKITSSNREMALKTSSEHRQKLVNLEKAFSNIQKQLIEAQRIASYAEILEKRPAQCKIDDCSFLKEGWKGVEAQKSIEPLQQQLDKNRQEQEECRKNIEYWKSAEIFHNGIEELLDIETRFDSKITVLFEKLFENFAKYPYRWNEASIKKLFASGYLMQYLESLKEGEIFFDFLDMYKKLSQMEGVVKTSQEKLEYIANNTSHIQNIKNDIQTLTDTSLKMKDEIAALEAESAESSKQLLKLKDDVDTTQKYLEMKREYSSKNEEKEKIEKRISSLHEKLEVYNNLTDKLENQKAEIAAIEKSLDNERSVLATIMLQLKKHEEFNKRHEEYNERAVKEKLIREACDPKKGIPLQFMQDFLSTTEDFANTLLDIAYGGTFHIKFEVDEKNFTIPVFKDDGESRPDVKYASDGETSLIKTIVSLSLLSRYVRLFPIFCLDEVDAVLDNNYRTSFVNILMGQIKTLSLQQVFIISHNEELMNDSINLVLFPGSNFEKEGSNNNIIAEF